MQTNHYKIGLAYACCIALGAIGYRVAVSSPALAQINTFHAVTVSAVPSGTAAWIIGQDGSTRLCTVGANGAPTCVPVRY